MFLKRKKQKFDAPPKVSSLMNGKCVCEHPCNEYCSVIDLSKSEDKNSQFKQMKVGRITNWTSISSEKPKFPDDRITSR